MTTTYAEATSILPANAECSSCFGNPGEGGYVEYWRTPDGGVWTVSNGPYDAVTLDWRCAGNPKLANSFRR
jgi:hypothetical protein